MTFILSEIFRMFQIYISGSFLPLVSYSILPITRTQQNTIIHLELKRCFNKSIKKSPKNVLRGKKQKKKPGHIPKKEP